MTRPDFAAWLAASRAASNVPVKVEDRDVLLHVAAMLIAAAGRREGGGDDARPAA
jgi:hypothetical protein